MTVLFWVVNGLLLLLALYFVAAPLLRHKSLRDTHDREQLNIRIHRERLEELEREYADGTLSNDAFESARGDLENTVLADVPGDTNGTVIHRDGQSKTLIAVLVVFPVFVVLTYLMLGNATMVGRDPDSGNAGKDAEMPSVEEMIIAIKSHLDEQPDDGRGWRMLARAYMVSNLFDEAVDALRNARKYQGDEPALLADLSEALIISQDNALSDEAIQLANEALRLNPDEAKALWISGYAKLHTGNLEGALADWEHLLELLQPNSSEAQALAENIAQLRQQRTGANTDVEPVGKTGEADTTNAVGIDVSVDIDDDLKSRTSPMDTVFVFARASQGPRMPLAIVKTKVGQLPTTIRLDDTTAMSPAMTLSQHDAVVIVARVSSTGDAMPRSGDLTGVSAELDPADAREVTVRIDQVIP